jgi:hypothetical protein
MNVLRGLLLFGSSLLATGCFDAPEYSVVPIIKYSDIYFLEGTADNPVESLVVTVSFKDGDGDLGLFGSQIDDPYHDVFHAIADGGNVIEVAKESRPPYPNQLVKIPPGAMGKLVTNRTLLDPQYAGKLPPFISAYASCTDYSMQTLYVREEDAHILDDSFSDVETELTAVGQKVFVVKDLFYKRNNPNHDNIEVEFWLQDASGGYTLFDWEQEYCETAFDQRFPVLSEGPGAVEGELEYAMTSLGIRASLGTKTLKLRIRIRDRAFNVSNEVETGDFTLDKIRRLP